MKKEIIKMVRSFKTGENITWDKIKALLGEKDITVLGFIYEMSLLEKKGVVVDHGDRWEVIDLSPLNTPLILWTDLEVSSFNSELGALTQISCILERGGIEVGIIDLRINPNTYNRNTEVLDYNLKRSNRTWEEVITYPESQAQFYKIEEFLESHIEKDERVQLAGHNVVNHDSKFIEEWFKDNNSDMYSYFSHEHLDTLYLARWARHWGKLKGCENLKLKTLCDYLGVPPFEWHDSIEDIRATKTMHEKLKKLMVS